MNKNTLSTLGAFLSMFGMVLLSAAFFNYIIKEPVRVVNNLPLCTQADIYDVIAMSKEWGDCSDGIQRRPLIRMNSFNCNEPGRVSVPELERSCEAPEIIIIKEEEERFKIISEDLSLLKVQRAELVSAFPKIKVNHPNFKDAYIRATIDFNQHFKDNYSGLIEGRNAQTGKSARYVFALKYFIDDLDNGGFVDVIRKDAGNVDLWVEGGLLGAYSGRDILGGKEFTVPLEKVRVAVGEDEIAENYRYTYKYPEKYLKSKVGQEVVIGAFISNNEGNLIKSLDIVYTGEPDAFELIK